jgi:hypothetical protein
VLDRKSLLAFFLGEMVFEGWRNGTHPWTSVVCLFYPIDFSGNGGYTSSETR